MPRKLRKPSQPTKAKKRKAPSGDANWPARSLGRRQLPHSDLSPAHLIGLNRKLSLAINLTDPRRYRGGDLLLKDVMGNVVAVERLRARGSVIVFPSPVLHIASPVTRGVRQSLVAWVLGPSLR